MPVLPVPIAAPPPPVEHSRRGQPGASWTYRDRAGAVLGYVWRFDGPGGAKDFMPLTWCRHPRSGPGEWRWKSWPPPRPLYGLDHLAARPEGPVVVCEGEKAADAAARLLPDWVATTSPNGSQSAGKADWSVLAARRVVIWPDADAAGQKYAEAVARALTAVSATVAMIIPPGVVKAGWDAADALAEGWDVDRVRALVEAARTMKIGTSADPRRRRGGDGSGRARRDYLVEFASAVEFWRSPDREPFATVLVDRHVENWPVRGKGFRRWLAGGCYDDCGIVPSGQTIEDALRVLEMKALRGPEYRSFLRVGEWDGKIYLDLGDEAWRAVEVTAEGWAVVAQAPTGMRFIRPGVMHSLPEPARGESVALLRPLVNVASEDDFKLVVAWLVAALRPRGPYPVLAINGEQGTAKSMLSQILVKSVDPHGAPLRALPRDERDLAVAAHNAWMIAFDNLSHISEGMSDALCRLATGAGFGTRELHSDRDEVIFTAQRPIIMNGISDVALRPDLGDRAITITLSPIPRQARRVEAELWADFEAVRPEILGALLDGVAAALRDIGTVKVDGFERMADFMQWGIAAEPGLGWEPGSFVTAYSANCAGTIELGVEMDPVASAVRAFANECAEAWEGSAGELLPELEQFVSVKVKESRAWPATPAGLANRLRRAASGLRQMGIEITIGVRAMTRDRKRLITISRQPS